MSFDPTRESPVALRDVPKLPWLRGRRRGKKLHISTVYRWVHRGLRGRKLEVLRLGGGLFTSEEALLRFFRRISEPPEEPPPDRQRQREIAAAEATLDADGI